jgi:hypothetical protein
MAKHQVDIIIQGYDRASGEFAKAGTGLTKAFGAITAGISVYSIANFFKSSIEEFARYEESIYRLAGALSVGGKDGIAAAAGMTRYADELENLTGIHDELIIKAMGLGSALGKLSGKDLEGATRAAIGWATILQKDVDTAMSMVAKAALGNFTRFEKLGMKFDDCASDAERFNKVIIEGERGFLITQAMATGTAGEINKMGNAYKNFRKGVGEDVSGITGFFTKHITYDLAGLTDISYALRHWSLTEKRAEHLPEMSDELKKNLELLGKYVDTGEDAAGMTDAQKKATEEYKKAMSELNKEIATFGWTKEGKKLYDFLPFLAPETSQAYFDKVFDLDKMTKAKELTDKIGESYKNLLRDIAAFGAPGGVRQLFDLMEKGASEEQLAPLAGLIDKMQRLEDESKRETKPLGRLPGWAPFEAQHMMGYTAPRIETNYEAQTARYAKTATELLKEISQSQKQLLQKTTGGGGMISIADIN